MTDQKEWARKLMGEKRMACKDDKRRWGTAQTVVHIYPLKEPLLYEVSLIFSPTHTYIPTPDAPQGNILPQQDMGIVDSGKTNLYIAPSTPHGPTNTSAAAISVGTENLQIEIHHQKLNYPSLSW